MGEVKYYELRGGERSADAIAKIVHGQGRQPRNNRGSRSFSESTLREFERAHAAMYRGRLWINQLTRTAVLSPRFASIVLKVARFQPSILRLLTRKITTTPPET